MKRYNPPRQGHSPCVVVRDHECDFRASFEGGDTYRCRKCHRLVDATED